MKSNTCRTTAAARTLHSPQCAVQIEGPCGVVDAGDFLIPRVVALDGLVLAVRVVDGERQGPVAGKGDAASQPGQSSQHAVI